ncbi:MAG: B12-binding domain-containing radical SAM protein [Promethearchaeota archaeon]
MKKEFIDIMMIFPSGGMFGLSDFKYHLGAAYIIAYLQKNSFSAEQFISTESLNVKECVKKISEYNPKIVGFTVYDTNYMQCVLIGRGLKAYNSNITIIFGGPTPTVQSREIMGSNHSVDICVRGEGEETVLELVKIFSQNNYFYGLNRISNLKGITFRKDNKIIFNQDSDILLLNRKTKNFIDKYPSPYLSGIIPPSEAFFSGLITARGCNQNCIYCNCSVLSKKNIFTHSIDRVIDELKFFNDYKEHKGPISIHDDGFTIIPSRAKEICKRIIENNIKLPLTCVTRCDKITEDLLDIMKQAGFVSIGFSLESAVPRILRIIGKVNLPEDKNKEFSKEKEFLQNLRAMTTYAKKIGFQSIYASIMVGLPTETPKDAQKTLEFVSQLDIDYYQPNYFHIFKGTPIYQEHKKYGYEVKPVGLENKIFTTNDFPFDVFKIKWVPKSTMETNYKVIDFNNLKILTFNPTRPHQKPFFENLIINSDLIKSSLVEWLQENLAINGSIIQIYSNKQQGYRLHKDNDAVLKNNYSPSLYFESYYWSRNHSILNPMRIDYYSKKTGLPITLKNTFSVLKKYFKGDIIDENIICTENQTKDVQILYDLLGRISKSEDGFNYLLESRPLPFFQKICRWTENYANCLTLETVIVDEDNFLRICWDSDPIGKVGTPYKEIKQNLENLHSEKLKIRGCKACNINYSCFKCLYPDPLSSTEYCKYKKEIDTTNPSNLIITLQMFREFLFNPIIPRDY